MDTREVMLYEIVNDFYQVHYEKLREEGWSDTAIELYCLCHQTTLESDAQVFLGTMSDKDIERELNTKDLLDDD